MIKISLVVFLLVLQALLVSVLLAVFALLRVRKLSTRLAARRVPAPPPAAEAPNDAAHYLATELQRTRGRLEGLGGSPTGANSSTTGRLALRAELLQMEAEWAGLPEQDDEAWNRLDTRMQALLARATAASGPPANPAAEKNEVATKQLLDEQLVAIENLKAAMVTAASHPEAGLILQTQFEQLGRTARELTFCVAILEDENQFLRDQVRALLQAD
jgi:hypothetical protein